MTITEKEVLCPYKEGALYGILYTPEEYSGKLPMVIVSHGLYSSYQMTMDTAKRLAENGFATYIFDFRGCSYTNKSGGDLLHCSIKTEQAELSAVIDFVKQLDFVDNTSIFLLGQSMGGIVSALTAADRAAEVAGLVMMYPATIVNDFAMSLFKTVDDVPEVIEKVMGIPQLNVGKMFFVDIMNTNVLGEMRRYEKPVYVITGTDDVVVPVEYARKAAECYKNAVFKVVKGAVHGFNLDEMQAKEVADFLNNI